MRDVANWSVSCCRDADLDVRLHASLFMAIAGVLYLCGQIGAQAAVTAVIAIIYLLSLAAREAARAFVSWRWGGRVECIVLGPLGAVNPFVPHEDPRGDLAAAAAGPAANGAIALVAAATLAALGHSTTALRQPFSPPDEAFALSAVGCLFWLAWINGVLAIAACLPTIPLDGARAVAALVRRRAEPRMVLLQTARIGIAASLVLLIAALFVGRTFNSAALALTLIGIVGFFCSRREMIRGLAAAEGDDDPYEEPSLYETDESRVHQEHDGPLRRWWRLRQEAKQHRLRQLEQDEEALADELLARVHVQGMHSLTAQERALLERVSARYRRRL